MKRNSWLIGVLLFALALGGVAFVQTNKIPLVNLQNIASGKILGRSSAGTGAVEQITVGSGLSLSGGTLSATGTGTQSGIQFKDEGSNIGSSGAVTAVDCVGSGIACAHASNTITMTVNTPSVQTLLDGICSTRGAILERGASGWACITPGTSGHVLTSNGSGADPSYQAPTGGGSSLTVKEEDGSPSVSSVSEIKVTNGTLTDNGSGSVSVSMGGGSGEDFVRLYDTILVSSASSVTISSISGSYKHLRLLVTGRGTNASSEVAMCIRFNSDTGTNYGYARQSGNSSGFSDHSGSSNNSYIQMGYVAAASSSAGYVGSSDITIFDYASTTFNKSLVSTGVLNSGTTMYSEVWTGTWRSISAITSISVFPLAGNFATGTRITLYGLN